MTHQSFQMIDPDVREHDGLMLEAFWPPRLMVAIGCWQIVAEVGNIWRTLGDVRRLKRKGVNRRVLLWIVRSPRVRVRFGSHETCTKQRASIQSVAR